MPSPRAPTDHLLARTADEVFPFGKAALIILTLALVAAGWRIAHPRQRHEANLRLWTFAREHADAYKVAKGGFEQEHPGTKVDVQFVHMDAVTSRLRAALWAGLDVPELVEVEISEAGSFFRGPVEGVGFRDLKPLLVKAGLYDQLVQNRFAPYTYKGRIFGMPHDVHPVMLAYRADLFAELGIQAEELDTWDKFIEAGRRVTVREGAKPRYMIGLNPSGGDSLEMLLFQRGGGYFDASGQLIMDSDLALQTLLWFIPLIAGPERIGANPQWPPALIQNIMEGYVLCVICPDWRSKAIEKDVPLMKGKMKLMPLPAFADDPARRRTSTWGGTMIGITERAADPDQAFALARDLYLKPDDLAQRFRDLNILPPLKSIWKDPAFDEPREYWSGQPLGRLYADLAEQVPPQYSSPFVKLAKTKLGEVVASCRLYYDQHGASGFEAFARRTLKHAADQVRVQMARNPF